MTPAIRSTNPFYSFIFTTPLSQGYKDTFPGKLLPVCLEKGLACHCLESIHFMGMAIDRQIDLSEDEIDYIETLQNTIGNFIRTGNPNNWEGNPRPKQDIIQINTWRDSKMFNVFGVSGQYPENYRSEFCDKLDEMDEYMLH